jgi:uncharacterized protein (DUF1501 family)
MTIDRRFFLRGTAAGIGALAATSALGRWARRASAASTARYAGHRSLVAVFLLGGNDGNQLLVPHDARYSHYAAARPTIKLERAELLTLDAAYGLHPSMKRTRAAFVAANPTAAFVTNVGPVALATRKVDYDDSAHRRPTNLFSHSDQQDAWATALPIPGREAELANTGWGGRMAERLEKVNPHVKGVTYPAMTLVGGRRAFAASAGLPIVTNPKRELAFIPDQASDFYTVRNNALAEIAGHTGRVDLEIGYGEVLATATAVAAERTRAREQAWAALAAATRSRITNLFEPALAGWSLPAQLFTVLKDIVAGATAASTGLGLHRQVFSVGLGSFDTHIGQRATQDKLLDQLDFSLDAFHRSMPILATDPAFGTTPPESTLFTMSDFGRTLGENSDGGTDHAWGNHMIVVGSRVAGGQIHGVFPNLDLASTTDSTDERGRWIPTTSVDQYVMNLALWLGVGPGELQTILPNHGPYLQDAETRGLSQTYRRAQYPIMRDD